MSRKVGHSCITGRLPECDGCVRLACRVKSVSVESDVFCTITCLRQAALPNCRFVGVFVYERDFFFVPCFPLFFLLVGCAHADDAKWLVGEQRGQMRVCAVYVYAVVRIEVSSHSRKRLQSQSRRRFFCYCIHLSSCPCA